jgi:hypothetical protein
MTHICYARAERSDPHTIRCAVCRLSWDVDDRDLPPCPRSVQVVPERLPFASGLPFVDNLHKR